MFTYIEVRQKKKKKNYKIPVQMPACPSGERDMDNFTHDGGIAKEEQAGDAKGTVEEIRRAKWEREKE